MNLLLSLRENHPKLYPWLLMVASVLLLCMSWWWQPIPFLFVAFVPLFLLEEHYSQYQPFANLKWFLMTYLTLLLWNVGDTWWVYHATIWGALMMVFANSMLMLVPWWIYRLTKKWAGLPFALFCFITYWITFEYFHLNWEVSWPWLSLGNSFAFAHVFVQWYSVTGTFGGALWVLVTNVILAFILIAPVKRIPVVRQLIWLGLWVLVPMLVSWWMYARYEEQGKTSKVTVMQPNIDPYTEKFVGSTHFIPFSQQLDRFIELSEKKISDSTQFLVWPETALDNTFDEDEMMYYPLIRRMVLFKQEHPQLSILTGLTTVRFYHNPGQYTRTMRYSKQRGYYDVFNSALFINDQGGLSTYHKSRLVPGAESLPYPEVLKSIVGQAMFDLGGTSGGFGRQKTRTVFYNSDSVGVAPAICYESIYGDFMSQYVKRGAGLIFVITNDGWWGDTPGYKQHLAYARLRAIENRRDVARSANTGISAFINQRGDITKKTKYWEQDVIQGDMHVNKELTFYSEHGDYLGRTAAWLAGFLFLSGLVKRFRRP